MRHDMVERFSETKGYRSKRTKFPRRHKKVAKTDQEGLPTNVTGMRKVHAVAGHMSGHYQGGDYDILTRFLVSNRGRPWDEVYSEICQSADYRHIDGHRLREAIGFIVEQNCTVNEHGEICDSTGGSFARWRRQLYVHPETKKLEWHGMQKRWRKKVPIKTVFEVDGQLFHKHSDGNWYRVEMREVQRINRYYYEVTSITDAFQADHSGKRPFPFYWDSIRMLTDKYGISPDGNAWYCVKKQSASSKEIKKLKKMVTQ